MEQFGYYMIRIRHSPTGSRSGPLLSGIVERLGAGEKQSFAGGEELLRLLSGWTEGLTNMRQSTSPDKAS